MTHFYLKRGNLHQGWLLWYDNGDNVIEDNRHLIAGPRKRGSSLDDDDDDNDDDDNDDDDDNQQRKLIIVVMMLMIKKIISKESWPHRWTPK